MSENYEVKVVDSCADLPDSRWADRTRQLEKEFAVKWHTIHVFEDDEIIGFMRIMRHPDLVDTWYAADVFVSEEKRRKGIAEQMYHTALEIVCEYDQASCVMAAVNVKNEASIRLHKRAGFFDSGLKPEFASFIFEEGDTMWKYWITNAYPAKNTEIHNEILLPMWKEYKLRGEKNGEDFQTELRHFIERANESEDFHFEIVWSGNDAIGFVMYSTDGKYKEVFVKENWKQRGIEQRWKRTIDQYIEEGRQVR